MNYRKPQHSTLAMTLPRYRANDVRPKPDLRRQRHLGFAWERRIYSAGPKPRGQQPRQTHQAHGYSTGMHRLPGLEMPTKVGDPRGGAP